MGSGWLLAGIAQGRVDPCLRAQAGGREGQSCGLVSSGRAHEPWLTVRGEEPPREGQRRAGVLGLEDYVGSTAVRQIRVAWWARAPWAKWRVPQKQVSDPPQV